MSYHLSDIFRIFTSDLARRAECSCVGDLALCSLFARSNPVDFGHLYLDADSINVVTAKVSID